MTGSLARKSLWMISVQIYGKALAFFWVIFAARKLGVEGFGQYGFATAIFAIFSVAAEGGLFLHQTRTFPLIKGTHGACNLLSESLVLRFILSLPACIIFAAIGFFSGKPEGVKVFILFLAFIIIVNNVAGAFMAVLYGYENFGHFGLISILSQTATTGLSAMALALNYGLPGIGIAQLAVAFATGITATFLVAGSICRPAFGVSWKAVRQLFRKAMPLGIMTILIVFYYRINFALLSYIQGDKAVGYYNAAFAIVAGLGLIPATLSSTLLPRMSQLFIAGDNNLNILYGKAFKYLLFWGLGFAFGGLALAPKIMVFLYSSEYMPSAMALSILVWAGALMSVNPIQGSMLVARSAYRKLVLMASIAALIDLILCIILVPIYGFVGAAVAVLTAEFSMWIMGFIYNRHLFTAGSFISDLWKAATAGTVMLLILRFVQFPSVVISIAAGILIYIIILIITRGLLKDDMITLRNMIPL